MINVSLTKCQNEWTHKITGETDSLYLNEIISDKSIQPLEFSTLNWDFWGLNISW